MQSQNSVPFKSSFWELGISELVQIECSNSVLSIYLFTCCYVVARVLGGGQGFLTRYYVISKMF